MICHLKVSVNQCTWQVLIPSKSQDDLCVLIRNGCRDDGAPKPPSAVWEVGRSGTAQQEKADAVCFCGCGVGAVGVCVVVVGGGGSESLAGCGYNVQDLEGARHRREQ